MRRVLKEKIHRVTPKECDLQSLFNTQWWLSKIGPCVPPSPDDSLSMTPVRNRLEQMANFSIV
ncbi:hypothetical protein PROFUN_07818 [Planoprotostelium fungivorum]|uniref:Uncharacterized protein n=1 Tax=Planoprotostelium fungivorum TaxID=1890364 RepID=A0A2P6MXC6_9EUKA|nr:hypothetical protein PROFUN_07818 [Planoprotostelium fungivorum]